LYIPEDGRRPKHVGDLYGFLINFNLWRWSCARVGVKIEWCTCRIYCEKL